MERIPRAENCELDNLRKIASINTTQIENLVIVEHISIPSVILLEPRGIKTVSIGELDRAHCEEPPK